MGHRLNLIPTRSYDQLKLVPWFNSAWPALLHSMSKDLDGGAH